MDPNTINAQPNFDLPEPVVPDRENKPDGPTSAKEKSFSTEKPGSEMGHAAPQTSPPPPALPVAVSPSAQVVANTADPIAPTTGMIADDVDLIEKEWVTKAKAIVQQTKTDPHTQNKELNKVKADYIKKRYNKDVKVSEE